MAKQHITLDSDGRKKPFYLIVMKQTGGKGTPKEQASQQPNGHSPAWSLKGSTTSQRDSLGIKPPIQKPLGNIQYKSAF